MASEKKHDELAIFNQWRNTGDKRHFQALYQSMKPLLDSAASKASIGSNLPKSAHEIWAAHNFHEALKTFDPNRGVALQTHVYGAVHQKAKRLNYLYQNLGQMPEPRAMQVGNYQTELHNLKDELGREPSAAELADRLSLNIRDVERLRKEVQKELSVSGLEDEVITESSRESEILDFLYYDLSNDQRVVFEYVFGKHGKSRLTKPNGTIDFDKIALKTGFSVSKVRSLWATVKQKYHQAAK